MTSHVSCCIKYELQAHNNQDKCRLCFQGRTTSPTKLSKSWKIRSDSARIPKQNKAAKIAKVEEKQTDEESFLPSVQSVNSVSASSTLDTHPEIRTANDVVEFYAKYGQDSPVKFFYCNRYLTHAVSKHKLVHSLNASCFQTCLVYIHNLIQQLPVSKCQKHICEARYQSFSSGLQAHTTMLHRHLKVRA